MELRIIARMENDFPTKFGLPRQGGLVEEVKGKVVMEGEYANPAALRGLEGFSHVWLIWGFSAGDQEDFSPTVRPPRLGGKTRVGVFATRSPFRPNRLGLSCVRLCGIHLEHGSVYLEVAGADLMDGTPIYDIKPYLPYTDSHPEALEGFAAAVKEKHLIVEIPEPWRSRIRGEKLDALKEILKEDPRPAYHDDPERIYGFCYAGMDVRFRVAGGVLTVCEVVEL